MLLKRRIPRRAALLSLAAALSLTLSVASPASAAVTASFSLGVLSVFGDDLDNNLTISRNAAGQILVNGSAASELFEISANASAS